MADDKNNFYDYVALASEPQGDPGRKPILQLLGVVEARDPDHALGRAAENWPPPADAQRVYYVTLASKWRSQEFRARPTVAVEPVPADEPGEAD